MKLEKPRPIKCSLNSDETNRCIKTAFRLRRHAPSHAKHARSILLALRHNIVIRPRSQRGRGFARRSWTKLIGVRDFLGAHGLFVCLIFVFATFIVRAALVPSCPAHLHNFVRVYMQCNPGPERVAFPLVRKKSRRKKANSFSPIWAAPAPFLQFICIWVEANGAPFVNKGTQFRFGRLA